MNKKLQTKLNSYKKQSKATTEQRLSGKIGLASTAALASMTLAPIALTSQVICTNLPNNPIRTGKNCVELLGPLGWGATDCAAFDLDADGIDDLQVQYYNFSNYYPYGSINQGMSAEPINNGVSIPTWGFVLKENGTAGFPANPVPLSTYHYFNTSRMIIVPLSGGGGFGFVTFDMNFIPPNTSANHPVSGEPLCANWFGFAHGGATMMGAQTGITMLSEISILTDDVNECPAFPTLVPVELSRFEAEANEKSILLSWTTESEVNNSGFDIERSIDGKQYETIKFVKGIGNSNDTWNYSFEDLNAKPNVKYYYRLKQIDFDGKSEYSDVLTSKIEGDRLELVLSPNPSNGCTAIHLSGSMLEASVIEIYSNTGSLMQTETPMSGNTQVDLDVSSLAQGIYFVKVQSGNNAFYEKLVIN